ncbi:MAG: hypothetical protein IKN27_11770 [Selenomonadaceae bacterium]|nr:hypothetical protein [Selenomonadaceae bacterium]
MTDLIIDNEFKDLIPPLTGDEKKQLEENILRDGIQDPLKVWQGTLIDGHNRYEIAQAHGLTFTTTEIAFDSRDDVKIWIIRNQLGRRNLIAPIRIKLALLAEEYIAAKAKERMEEGRNQYTSPNDICHYPSVSSSTEKNKLDRQNTTDYQLGQMAGVSDRTVKRYKTIQQSAPAEVKAKVDNGDISINAAYNKVQQAKRKEDVQRQIEEIEQQAVEKPDGLFDVIVIDPPWGYGREKCSLPHFTA